MKYASILSIPTNMVKRLFHTKTVRNPIKHESKFKVLDLNNFFCTSNIKFTFLFHLGNDNGERESVVNNTLHSEEIVPFSTRTWITCRDV